MTEDSTETSDPTDESKVQDIMNERLRRPSPAAERSRAWMRRISGEPAGGTDALTDDDAGDTGGDPAA